MTLTKSWRLTRIYARGIGDALSAHRPPNIPPLGNHKIMQGSRESLTQTTLNQASPATYIHATLPKQPTKPTTPITPKTKRRRSWASDTDRYNSNTADGDISEQEHARPNSDVFGSPLTTPTRSHHTQSNPQGNSRHTETHGTLRTKILKYLQDTLTTTKELFTLTGQNFAMDNHIPVLAANLYKTITGQQNPTTSHQDSPISEALKSLTEEVKRIAAKVDQQQPPRNQSPNPGLSASAHNPENARAKSYADAATSQKTNPPMATNPWSKAPTNPSKAHHPTCLAIVFDSTPPPDSRRDEATTVQDINASLTSKGAPLDLKITAIKWNTQGNCIAFTRTDQTAAAVLPFTSELPNVIAPGHNGQVREDKKWFKVEIQNVRTDAYDYNGSGIYTPQTIHQHLREVNPEYAALNVVILPRWIRPENELTNQPYSSVVFAVDSFDQHAHFLRLAKTMAAFGRLATTCE